VTVSVRRRLLFHGRHEFLAVHLVLLSCWRQLAAANECNQQLQVALQNEKLASAATARKLEGKLADTEDCLIQKVREVATARDVQTGLRIELDSLKSMIQDEEDRFVLGPAVCRRWTAIIRRQSVTELKTGTAIQVTGHWDIGSAILVGQVRSRVSLSDLVLDQVLDMY